MHLYREPEFENVWSNFEKCVEASRQPGLLLRLSHMDTRRKLEFTAGGGGRETDIVGVGYVCGQESRLVVDEV